MQQGGMDKGVIRVSGRMERNSKSPIMLLRMSCNLKLKNCLFLEFFIYYFRLWLAKGK